MKGTMEGLVQDNSVLTQNVEDLKKKDGIACGKT